MGNDLHSFRVETSGWVVCPSSFEWGRPSVLVLQIYCRANPITQLSDAKSPLMALHVPELRMMLANESSADIPYWNQWPSAHRVAPWLCGLMDSVLSVEGSQIYRQSAFNKKQVAGKVHRRANKGCKYITHTHTHTKRRKLWADVSKCVCLCVCDVWACDSERCGKTPRGRCTLWDACMNDEWQDGVSHIDLKSGGCCHVLCYCSSSPFLKVTWAWRLLF